MFTDKVEREDVALATSYESAMEEFDASQAILDGISVGSEAAANFADVTRVMLSNGEAITHPAAISVKLGLAGAIQQYGETASINEVIAFENATTPFAMVEVAHEGAIDILKKGWAILLRTIASMGAAAKKIYMGLASKIRRFDGRFDAVDKRLKEIKNVKYDDVTLDGSDWIAVKKNMGIIMASEGSKAFMGDTTLKSYMSACSDQPKDVSTVISTLLAVIDNKTPGEDIKHSTKLIRVANIVPSAGKISKAVGKVKDAYIQGVRFDGTWVSAIITGIKDGQSSATLVREQMDSDLIKQFEDTDKDKSPSIEGVKALSKAVQKMKIDKLDKSIEDLDKKMAKFNDKLKDAKEKSVDEVKELLVKKSEITKIAPTVTLLVRDAIAAEYNVKGDTLMFLEYFADEFEGNKKKKKKESTGTETETETEGEGQGDNNNSHEFKDMMDELESRL